MNTESGRRPGRGVAGPVVESGARAPSPRSSTSWGSPSPRPPGCSRRSNATGWSAATAPACSAPVPCSRSTPPSTTPRRTCSTCPQPMLDELGEVHRRDRQPRGAARRGGRADRPGRLVLPARRHQLARRLGAAALLGAGQGVLRLPGDADAGRRAVPAAVGQAAVPPRVRARPRGNVPPRLGDGVGGARRGARRRRRARAHPRRLGRRRGLRVRSDRPDQQGRRRPHRRPARRRNPRHLPTARPPTRKGSSREPRRDPQSPVRRDARRQRAARARADQPRPRDRHDAGVDAVRRAHPVAGGGRRPVRARRLLRAGDAHRRQGHERRARRPAARCSPRPAPRPSARSSWARSRATCTTSARTSSTSCWRAPAST